MSFRSHTCKILVKKWALYVTTGITVGVINLEKTRSWVINDSATWQMLNSVEGSTSTQLQGSKKGKSRTADWEAGMICGKHGCITCNLIERVFGVFVNASQCTSGTYTFWGRRLNAFAQVTVSVATPSIDWSVTSTQNDVKGFGQLVRLQFKSWDRI